LHEVEKVSDPVQENEISRFETENETPRPGSRPRPQKSETFETETESLAQH
jgi:hypothetical protein